MKSANLFIQNCVLQILKLKKKLTTKTKIKVTNQNKNKNKNDNMINYLHFYDILFLRDNIGFYTQFVINVKIYLLCLFFCLFCVYELKK